MNKPRSPTIFDIAEASGVSYSTVSRVLNGFEYVKADTRKRVLTMADELGYVANLQARSLAGGKSKIVGMLVPTLHNGYISAVTSGIDEALTRAGYDLMVYTTHHKYGKEKKYARAISGGLTDGLILMVPLASSSHSESSYLKILRGQGFPYVLVGQTDTIKQSNTVDSSNWQGAYDAIRYLLGLGHKHIGFITGHMEIDASKERLEGYRSALKAENIVIDERLVVEGDFSHESGYKAATKLLTLAETPTALFASNDVSAFGAMDAIRAKGFGIPEDISVIGFDDILEASLTYPKLTTVHQPLAQMGQVAVKLLLEQLRSPDLPPRYVTLKTHLVVRDTCRGL